MLVAALGLAGCGSSFYSSGSAAARSVARIGDTAAVVERKMGNPDKQQDMAAGQSIWTYANYLQRSVRPQTTGWSEVLVPAVVDQHGDIVAKPVTREVYRTVVKEDIRVTFKDGLVSAVESFAQP